jgi:hypothetical protein
MYSATTLPHFYNHLLPILCNFRNVGPYSCLLQCTITGMWRAAALCNIAAPIGGHVVSSWAGAGMRRTMTVSRQLRAGARMYASPWGPRAPAQQTKMPVAAGRGITIATTRDSRIAVRWGQLLPQGAAKSAATLERSPNEAHTAANQQSGWAVGGPPEGPARNGRGYTPQRYPRILLSVPVRGNILQAAHAHPMPSDQSRPAYRGFMPR